MNDELEVSYRRACHALVAATRDEVAAAGPEREALSRVVDALSEVCRLRWEAVLAAHAPIPYRVTDVARLADGVPLA